MTDPTDDGRPPLEPNRIDLGHGKRPGFFARLAARTRTPEEHAALVAELRRRAEDAETRAAAAARERDIVQDAYEDARAAGRTLAQENDTLRTENAKLAATVAVREHEVKEMGLALEHSRARWAAHLASEVVREARAQGVLEPPAHTS